MECGVGVGVNKLVLWPTRQTRARVCFASDKLVFGFLVGGWLVGPRLHWRLPPMVIIPTRM